MRRRRKTPKASEDPSGKTPSSGAAGTGQTPAPPDDFVEEDTFTVRAMPWVLVPVGVALITVGVLLWISNGPTRVSAQITRVTSNTSAPESGKAGTTKVDSTEKVLSVVNLPIDDKFKKAVLRGIAQPRQRVSATGAPTGGARGAPRAGANPSTPSATTGTTGKAGTTGTKGPSGATGPTGATGTSGAQSAVTASVAPGTRSEPLTLSLVFLGALFILGGAFYSRVTSLEAGPSGIKISVKALHYVKQGVLAAEAEARAAGHDVPPSASLDAFANAVARLSAAATVAAGRPAAVTAARSAIREPPAIQVKGSKVVLAPESLEEFGRSAMNSTLYGNPDFE
jgi:hypothetical protein